jgi:hypothetical protein
MWKDAQYNGKALGLVWSRLSNVLHTSFCFG